MYIYIYVYKRFYKYTYVIVQIYSLTMLNGKYTQLTVDIVLQTP